MHRELRLVSKSLWHSVKYYKCLKYTDPYPYPFLFVFASECQNIIKISTLYIDSVNKLIISQCNGLPHIIYFILYLPLARQANAACWPSSLFLLPRGHCVSTCNTWLEPMQAYASQKQKDNFQIKLHWKGIQPSSTEGRSSM